MSLSAPCKPQKSCQTEPVTRQQLRPGQAADVSASAITTAAEAKKSRKSSPTDFRGPSRIALALPWLLVAVMTTAAGAFYLMPEGRLGELLRAPTLAIGQQPSAGLRKVPHAPVTQPLAQSETRRQTVLTPVWETRMREEPYTIRKPVIETTYREEKYTVTEPITTYAPQTVDQGQWVDQAVAQPGPEHKRLKWVNGGWTTNERGQTYWQLPGLRLAKEQDPPTYTTMRVWQPNVVTTQVPQVSYKPTTKTRQVPVETVRYVEEQRVRKVPERFCRLVEKEVGSATNVSERITNQDDTSSDDQQRATIHGLPSDDTSELSTRYTET